MSPDVPGPESEAEAVNGIGRPNERNACCRRRDEGDIRNVDNRGCDTGDEGRPREAQGADHEVVEKKAAS